jgi:hypothetical protein
MMRRLRCGSRTSEARVVSLEGLVDERPRVQGF